MKKRTFLLGAVIGGVVSGVSALLFAPKSGKETRHVLKEKSADTLSDIKTKTPIIAKKVKNNTKEKATKVVHYISSSCKSCKKR